ncbi:MAG TPA: XRE family transcriptional regulator [Solirubrobacterales bacterium]|nr:XRE family transcriptional regulator [Solirubrobacterales bacterium]
MKQAFDPARLSLARQAAGLRKKDLAEKVGISPASITQYEAGNTLPPSGTLAKLALACGFPVDFLAYDGKQSRPSDSTLPYFRSLRSTRAFERDQAEAFAVLVWQVVRVFEEHVDLPEVSIPSLPIEEFEPTARAESLAEAVRAEWDVPRGPIGNVVNLLENHGAVCARQVSASSRVDAFSQWIDGRPFVLLWKTKNDGARSRFDAAHELGHLVMHPDADPGNKIMERQAHGFAAPFLMPADQILDELPRRSPTQRDIPALVDLRIKWGASISALYYRSYELGVISEMVYRRSMIRLSEFGFRKQEPGEVPKEEPSLLATALGLIEDALGYGLNELARETRLSEAQVAAICEVAQKPAIQSVPLRRIGS